ncbi:MAG: hypothetical protein AAF078_06915 [Planctomycetota bacterium]
MSVLGATTASAQLQYDVYQLNATNTTGDYIYGWDFAIDGVYNNPDIDFTVYEQAELAQPYGLSFFTGPVQTFGLFSEFDEAGWWPKKHVSGTGKLAAAMGFLEPGWLKPNSVREFARIAVPVGTDPMALPIYQSFIRIPDGVRLPTGDVEVTFQHLETVLDPAPPAPVDPETGYDLYRVSLTNDTARSALAFSVVIDGVMNNPDIDFAVDGLADQLLPQALSLFTHPESPTSLQSSDLSDEDTLAIDYFGHMHSTGALAPDASMEIAWISVPVGTDPYSLVTSSQLYSATGTVEDGGVLDFAGTGGLNFTYVATVIPEPTALALAAFGLGLVATRRSA